MKKIKNRFQHLPVAYTGLALGIGGLGNCLFQIFSVNNCDARWIPCISISIVSIILIMMFTKNVIHPKVLKYELHDPLTVSLIPNFSMSLMLVSGFIGMWDKSTLTSPCQIIAATIMCLSIVLQFIFIGYFTKSIIQNHIKTQSKNIYGSYFIPTVGLIISCTVAPNIIVLPNIFFQIIWYLSYGIFIITLPIITYSMLFNKNKISNKEFPTIISWFAPANWSCAGFLQVFMLAKNKDIDFYPHEFLYTLFILTTIIGFATSMLLYLYISRIFFYKWKNKLNFTPTLCSLSSPCATGAISMIWVAKKIAWTFFDSYKIPLITKTETETFLKTMVWFFGITGIIFATLTTIIISYLLFNMIWFGIKVLLTKHKDNEKHIVYL